MVDELMTDLPYRRSYSDIDSIESDGQDQIHSLYGGVGTES